MKGGRIKRPVFEANSQDYDDDEDDEDFFD